MGHDGNERIPRVFSAFSQSHLSIRPRFLNYQPKYPQNKRSPAIKDEVDFPLLSPLRALRPIGTLRSNVATATKTSLKKWIAFFQFLSQLFLSTYFVKCKRNLLELNSEGKYPNSKREIKFRRCLFTYSIKGEIRHFQVVVVQKRAKKCTKKGLARAKLLYWLWNLLFFFTFSSPSPSLDPKVPNVSCSANNTLISFPDIPRPSARPSEI